MLLLQLCSPISACSCNHCRFQHLSTTTMPDENETEAKTWHTIGSSLFVLLAASIIEFASAADDCNEAKVCDDEYYAWAIACGVISATICFVRLGFLYQKCPVNSKLDVILAIVLLVMWAFAAAFNTSTSGPFSATKNAYFATWIAFVAAAMYTSLALPMAYQALRTRIATVHTGLLLVLFASLVEMSVAGDVCDHEDRCEGRDAFAVAVGAVAATTCFIQLLLFRFAPSIGEPMLKIVAVFLVAWWSAGAAVNTSAKGPFNSSCGGSRGAANGDVQIPKILELFGLGIGERKPVEADGLDDLHTCS
ncbi:hypothetical protein PTSG_03274 [Salpingoeca rosetta]|uniref:MARVEL domain-containing protein n=1 Tax=Salpingoeca rosetta (strain ATCC 50818 / BSB-021) TaxID=946362 RepID=F2U4Q3_SALR5|nr:uncharacterized protein PTSG_03274 [Salpingoeca rosetta]EGD82619.1 hypothetical protein PTSG_03274 [Salpingoeca rosetta]|eukprot:XP_004995855.1 hypothetical protein PTSG_03274 [Salpingoeca rosetta]